MDATATKIELNKLIEKEYETTKTLISSEYYETWYSRNDNIQDKKFIGHILPRIRKTTYPDGEIKTIEISYSYGGYKTKKQHKYAGMKYIKRGKSICYSDASLKSNTNLDWEYELVINLEKQLCIKRQLFKRLFNIRKQIKSLD